MAKGKVHPVMAAPEDAELKSSTAADPERDVGKAASDVYSKASGLVTKAADNVKESAGEVYENVAQSDAGKAVSDKLGQAHKTVEPALQSVQDRVDQVKGAAGDASAKGREVASNVSSQVEGMADDMYVQMVHGGPGKEQEGPLAPNNVAQSAGQFFGAMRAQKGGVGQEAEAFSRGVKSTADTAEKVWDKVPEEAKETVAKGATEVTATVERLWTKFFRVVEHTLDWIDQKCFPPQQHKTLEKEEEEEEPTTLDAIVAGGAKTTGWFGLRKRSVEETKRLEKQRFKAAKEKTARKQKRWNMFSAIMKLTGGILGLTVASILCFLLGFLLLPLIFAGVLVSIISLQFWACCGLAAP